MASAEDILEEYNIVLKQVKKAIKPENETEAKILAVLTGEPRSGDDIIRQTGLEVSQVNVALAMMELNKKVKNLGNNKFVIYT